MFDTVDMLHDYEIFSKQKLELFNMLIKVDLGLIKREDLVLPVGLIEKHYKALDDYIKCLGLSLNLLGVEVPDIDWYLWPLLFLFLTIWPFIFDQRAKLALFFSSLLGFSDDFRVCGQKKWPIGHFWKIFGHAETVAITGFEALLAKNPLFFLI